MKKFLLMIVLVLFFIPTDVFAPISKKLAIIVTEVNIYEKLMFAILQIESAGDTLAYNPIEQAYGPFQIRPIRLTDYNKQTGKKYTMRDCYTMKVSREVFLYYAKRIGTDYETIAKRWNGSGPMTIDYWNKVKRYL